MTMGEDQLIDVAARGVPDLLLMMGDLGSSIELAVIQAALHLVERHGPNHILLTWHPHHPNRLHPERGTSVALIVRVRVAQGSPF